MITSPHAKPYIQPYGSRFVDCEGRQVLLHGINLVNKNPLVRYLGDEGPETFAAFREWGFNCVRLGVIWDGLEPEPGVYDDMYLSGLDRRIAWARDAGLVVYLDMHQDLYSVLYSDGAPRWATLSEGAPHVTGEVWSDAYFTSPAVQTALDNFWANAPAPDGMGLQDHLARCWALLAARYATEPAVIGYDLLNEPVPGSKSARAQTLLFQQGARLLKEMGVPESEAPLFDPARQWLTPEGRSRLLDLLRDPDLYARIIDATQPVYATFEQEALMPYYRRVAALLWPASQRSSPSAAKALFLETAIGANMGVVSHIEPVSGGPVPVSGCHVPPQVYAPHGYDLVTDTANLSQASSERVALIFRRHAETAARLGMPLLVGEWGAYGEAAGTLGVAREVVRQFEALLCGETYWAYQPGIEDFPCFRALHRPYPERVAGDLTGYRYDPERDAFTCSWREPGTGGMPTLIYLPEWFWRSGRHVELAPPDDGFAVEPMHAGSGSVLLSLPPLGDAIERRLQLV
jgi:endoglycosylceramidase